MSKYLDSMKAHFNSLGLPSMTIPEWIVEEKPMIIYWKPLTVIERQTIAEGTSRDVDIFILKALDDKGERLFGLADKPTIDRLVAPQIITRVAAKMMELPTPDAIEKK